MHDDNGGKRRVGLRAVVVLLLLALGCKVGLAQIGPRYVLELATGAHAAAAPAQQPGSLRQLDGGLALIRFQGLTILTMGADAAAFSADAARQWPAADLLLLTPAAAGRYAGLAPLALPILNKLPVIVPEHAFETGLAYAGGGQQRFYPLQTWDALHLYKGKTRLRVTALPGRAGTRGVAGYLLEVGNSRMSYRLYVSCEALADDELDGLPQRLPGADLALLPGGDAPRLLVLGRDAPTALAGARPGASSGNDNANRKPAPLTAAGYAFTPLKR